MNTVIINVLCEGQTEERFVNEVLKPYFRPTGVVLKHRLLVTSRKKDAHGGMLSYSQARGDLMTWIKENSGRASETHYYTTMFDFYALPDDFPGFDAAGKCSDPYRRVETLEAALSTDINCPRFIPYIQLHEFEALCFCDIRQLTNFYPGASKQIERLARVLDDYDGNPELINNSRQTAPNKRIVQCIEQGGKYHYNKPMTGVAVTKSIGIDALLLMCRHFREWIERLASVQGRSF